MRKRTEVSFHRKEEKQDPTFLKVAENLGRVTPEPDVAGAAALLEKQKARVLDELHRRREELDIRGLEGRILDLYREGIERAKITAKLGFTKPAGMKIAEEAHGSFLEKFRQTAAELRKRESSKTEE